MNNIISPVLTEKSAANIGEGLYVFAVTRNATKTAIAKDLKNLYDVTAVSVRIVNLPAKRVNFKRKPGIRSARRKAYVQLAPKQKIAGFEVQKDDKADKAEKETS